ncbi:MAG: alpha/beta hydrolase [Bacteroidales bacterium]|nr:alpha/beta hydrolase [Bacteroidales bacterium]
MKDVRNVMVGCRLRKGLLGVVIMVGMWVGATLLESCSTTMPASGPQGRLAAKMMLPAGFDTERDSCVMVILMHGIFSSKDYPPMPTIACELARQGIGSVRFDFNGHGKSDGKMEEMTIARELADARAIWDSVVKLPYVTAVVLLGHSQGGAVASMLAGELARDGMPPAGLVLLAPGSIIKEATQGGRFFGQEFDPADPPAYIKCFHHYKLGRDYLVQTQLLDIYGTAELYQGPVCIIHGADDGIVPLWCSERYHEIYQNSQLYVLKGENHLFLKKGKKVARLVGRMM